MAKKTSPPTLANRMAADAAQAVKLADVYFTELLDYSYGSIKTLEKMVGDIHYAMPGGKSAANVDLLCQLWGAYLGEVLRRGVDGEWVEGQEGANKAIALQCAKIKIFPHDKVRKRIEKGEAHNLHDYCRAFGKLMTKGK